MPKRTPRPEVTPANYETVYEWYSQHEPSQLALKSLHRVMSWLYHPRTQYADGADERIDELLAKDYRLYLACNHVNMFDQLAVASVMQRGPLKPTIGHTIALAKQPYFVGDQPLRRAMRHSLDLVGAMPVYRGQDTNGHAGTDRLKITRALFSAIGTQTEAGRHVFLFPEGTRNRGDPARLQTIQSGIGHMALETTRRGVPAAIVPIVLWYGLDEIGEPVKHSFRPNAYVGEPLEPPFANPAQITRDLTDSMTTGLEQLQKAA